MLKHEKKILSLKLTFLDSFNPFTNLATENQILLELPQDRLHLLFYINRPSIVMGRFQNPFIECDLEEMESRGIDLVRRQSGGGCVYHDEGNLNYSILAPRWFHSKDFNHHCILEALNSLGVQAQQNQRGDLVLGNPARKFSGSAYKEKKDVALHHGTLLIHSNLEHLNRFLRPPARQIDSKSTPSVRSTVVNLSEIQDDLNMQSVVDAIGASFTAALKLPADKVEIACAASAHEAQICSFDWILGETPLFDITLLLGPKSGISLKFRKLILKDLGLEGDIFHPAFEQILLSTLQGEHMLELEALISNLQKNYSMYEDELELLKGELCKLTSVPRKLSKKKHWP